MSWSDKGEKFRQRISFKVINNFFYWNNEKPQKYFSSFTAKTKINNLKIEFTSSFFLFPVPNRSSPNSPSRKNYFYHYINAGIYDVDHKFGDSCRQSLTSVAIESDNENNRNTIEFDYKRNVIRETSSANCSPKKFLLSSLKRTDSYHTNHQHIDDDIEDLELKEASWFHSGLPRESLEVLAQKSPGDFIVRRSNNKNGSFTLSLRIPGGSHKIAHYLIVKTHRGYKIKVRVESFKIRNSHANLFTGLS